MRAFAFSVVPPTAPPLLARGYRWLCTSRRAVPAIMLLALALRLALILVFPITPIHDSEWYLVRGRELAAGLGYQEGGHGTAFWPVGYPALVGFALFVFGPTLFGPILFNLIAQAATLALILWFARRLTEDEATARIAALLYAIYPAHIVFTGDTAAEPTSTALVMAGMALLLAARGRSGVALLAGITLGLATLMRPQFLLLAPFQLAVMAIVLREGWRPLLRSALLTAAGMALAIAPWTARNIAVLHAPVLVSTNGGVALQAGANDLADGGYFQIEKSPQWAEVGIPFAQRTERQIEIDARLKAMAKAWIVAHPVRWGLLGFRKIALLWSLDTDAFWTLDASYPELALAWKAAEAVNQLYYYAILAIGLVGFALAVPALWRRREDGRLLIAATMPVFCSGLAYGFTGQTRYHYPALPFVMIASAAVLVRLAAKWQAARADD